MARKLYRHSRRPANRVIKGESRAHKLQAQNRVRLMGVVFVMGVVFGGLALRLIEVSLIGGGELPFKRLVSQPHLLLQMEEKGSVISAASREYPRGKIIDRNGMLLAANLPTASLAANPQLIREPELVAQMLSSVLSGVDAADLTQKLTKPNSSFAYIKRQLTPAEQQAVHALGVPGLFFEHGMRRVYPMGEQAAHVLGFVNVDNVGLAGVEQHFDKRLRFTHGEEEALQLSIDMRVQSLMAQELKAVMQKFSAKAAAGLVMDVHSGELLSMVSLPSFDPHQAGDADADQRFNRVALGTYELGSAFKTFTMAMALDKGVVNARDGYDTSHPIYEAGFKISDYKPFYRWLSVPEIFAYSSNVGTVKVLQDVGFEEQTRFMKKLGFMESLRIEVPERAQTLVPHQWKPLNHMTASYGHGISVSPLHLARAMSAMVNGGELPKVTLLKQNEKSVRKGARVIKEETSKEVRELMRLVVDYGTARKAQVNGYAVGGKTGTAEKIINGRYHDDKKITSFISAFPIDNPRYVMFVMVDEPKPLKETFGYATGGWVAAPVTSRIIERMGPMLGVQPVFSEPDPREVEFWEASRRRNKEARQAHYRRQRGGVHAASY